MLSEQNLASFLHSGWQILRIDGRLLHLFSGVALWPPRSLDTVSGFRGSRAELGGHRPGPQSCLNVWARVCSRAYHLHLKIKHKLFLDFLRVCIIDDGDFLYWLGWLRTDYNENRTVVSLSLASFVDKNAKQCLTKISVIRLHMIRKPHNRASPQTFVHHILLSP